MPDFNLEDVVEISPEELTDEHKTFLQENVDNLTDEQAESFGIKKPEPEPKEPELRFKPPEKKEPDGTPPGEPAIDPEDEATIGKVVDKQLKPHLEWLEEQTERSRANEIAYEIDTAIADQPELKQYEKQIRAFVTHPNRMRFIKDGLPVSSVIAEAVAPHQQKIGAKKEREAAAAANDTKDSGSGARKPTGEGKDWLAATKEDFLAKRAEVMGQER